MDYIEISAKTVDDAITKACIEIGTSSDNLDIKVISEGSSGFLGFGSKPAIIKACKKPEEVPEPKVDEKVMKPEKVQKEVNKDFKKEQKKDFKEQKKEKKEFYKEFKDKRDFKENREFKDNKEFKEHREPVREIKREQEVVIRSEVEIEEIKQVVGKFLKDVFAAMDIPAEITIEYDNVNGNLNVDFAGDDMGILIGKRGQTLDSLQYITSLVVNKGKEGYIRVKLDTENYRNRRKDTLENLARNIAYRVRKTRKSVSLEPMNPYERRIIHSSLQGNKYVETYSEGNEPYRHVVVTLKK